MEPRRGHDVCAALPLEEKGEPKWYLAPRGGPKFWCRTLQRQTLAGLFLPFASGGIVAATRSARVRGQILTPNRSMLSSLWRGTTVTSSISQRNATSEGTRPTGKGSAIRGVGGITVGRALALVGDRGTEAGC